MSENARLPAAHVHVRVYTRAREAWASPPGSPHHERRLAPALRLDAHGVQRPRLRRQHRGGVGRVQQGARGVGVVPLRHAEGASKREEACPDPSYDFTCGRLKFSCT